MRIYLENFNYQNINFNNLKKYNNELKEIIEIYTDNGLFLIDNKRIFSLKYKDGLIEKCNNYINSINLILDKTIIKKNMNMVSHVPINNIQRKLKLYFFRLREKSPLKLVLTYENDIIVDMYFMLFETYAAYSIADLNNFSIKEDIVEFLNYL
tara:strand:+ start:731 stop:1189 length:459 start_codon:yes stop_codon:yes gene_type:complete